VLSDEHDRVYIGTGRAYTLFSLARPCVFWHGPCVLTGLRFLRFSCFFTHFCFELAFDINMKVLDNFISFPMALFGLENVLWILSYFKNTPSRSWKNLTKI